MATTKTESQKVAEYRKQAQDKTLPQEVRDQADMKANQIEARAAGKAGVKLAKGGMPMGGGFSGPRGGVTGGPLIKQPPRDIMAPKVDKTKPMPKIDAATAAAMNKRKAVTLGGGKPLNATMMAKGGSVKKAKK